MDIESENPRSRMISTLLAPFVGPLPEYSHCHICLDSWYPTSSESDGKNDFCCDQPVRINHKNCSCWDIVIGQKCLSLWLQEKDTCPMCRGDLFETLPPHLRHPPPLTEASDNEEATVVSSAFVEEEYAEDDGLEEQSWLYSEGNYIHSHTVNGEVFTVSDIIEMFADKQKIEAFKTEDEKREWFTSLGTHTAVAWEKAYEELVKGRNQLLENLFTVHGPVCIEGVAVEAESPDSWQ